MILVSNDGWKKLTRYLTTDPEIVSLKKRYHEITGRYLPGWNWNSYRSLDHYVECLRQWVAEAEATAQTDKQKKDF